MKAIMSCRLRIYMNCHCYIVVRNCKYLVNRITNPNVFISLENTFELLILDLKKEIDHITQVE
jgi:hypothetical protein